MHWKGLRLVPDGSSKRQSTLDPYAQSRRSEHLPRPSPPATEPRLSESTTRLPGLAEPDGTSTALLGLEVPENGQPDGVTCTDFGSSSAGDTSSVLRNRFSFMRLRHASDPQLSKTYAKDQDTVPPVPSLPPPKIITTAPTSNQLDQPVKQRHKLRLLPISRKHSMEELPRKSTEQSTPKPSRRNQGSTDSHIAESSLSTSQGSMDEPGRLSTTSLRSGGRDQPNDPHRVSVIDPRFSESSRSDQSYGDQAAYRTNSPAMDMGPPPTSSPPLPVASQTTTAGKLRNRRRTQIPPADTPKSEHSDELDHVSPLPSPSRSSVGLSATGAPPLSRNDSTNSARSLHSNPSHQGRGRSSTMGSLAENQEDLSPVPYLASSGRTSTSTSGRKSFGDLFNITQRLRQNSEPPIPRNASPGLGGASTPISKPEPPPCPERQDDDTPAAYLARLEENLPRGMVAGPLCQSPDEFFKIALRKYMRGFAYFGDPIDMSIRKLLMEVELPKETQQIDRFLQAFADRYHECNPGIFASTDQAYFIAFSILILHTDVFNKNNKRKMQKPDYVKNTRGEGISDDILECFYENISYTPFIHVEDANLRERHLAKPRRTLFKSTSSEHLPRVAREPVDPYTLILDGKVQSLRPSLGDVMDLDDTYNHFGTAGPPDMDDLHQAFTKSGILQIVSLRSRPDAFMQASLDNPAESNPGLVDIKVAKVGLLWRKDPKKKRARSPWQEWGAILTFSQLYFFRNVTWVRSLMAQYDAYVKNGRHGTLVFRPPLADFKPDAIMSTNDAVALMDTSYKKHKYAFMFVRHNALEEIFLAGTDGEMNDWIAKLNYAAAFRTTGVRTKGMIATNYEGQRYRTSQRISSISSLKSRQSMDKEPPSPSIDTDIVAEFVAARRQLMSQKVRETNEKLLISQKQLDELLQNARHLQILTPVHPRAREGVIMAAGRMSAKLKWIRQDIWRNKCYREVLLRDLGEDEEEFEGRTGSVVDQPPPTVGSIRLASTSGPSVTSEPSVGRAPSVIHTASSHDTTEPAAPSVDRPVEHGLLTQLSVGDMRRPSIPASTTSADVARAGRRLSAGGIQERAKSTSPDPKTIQLEREASVLSRGSRLDEVSLGSRGSKLTSPASYDDGEERLLRDAGLLDLGGSSPSRNPAIAVSDEGADSKTDGPSEMPQGDMPSRVRRSLHRTLRDSHHGHGHHSRGRKGRESVSSTGSLDDNRNSQEGEVLPRKAPSFTVHGKKASIVTFGSEWQNMPPEERLKLRKPTPSEEPRASDPAIIAGGETASDRTPGRAHSLCSTSTTTGLSLGTHDEPADFKDAAEELPVEDSDRPLPQVTASVPDPVLEQSETENTPRSPSHVAIYNGHLAAPGDDRSTSASSTSLSERVMDTPSQENLRQQAVGA
ncbi:hypothetical protein NUU61_008710 [Penicillium alfredii]|uniref:SEC7 domain-containing protein n=1 Tax=Penicillium alfredii TaxID=1506179 RepID=A0A9W9ELZ6_9EURO|nr:uncharacterized protein NUU61_008710 [Penicillium alfredii]KAJ5084131.1 hypothetical protein NUU61_008710 [Penicillium alfredii]